MDANVINCDFSWPESKGEKGTLPSSLSLKGGRPGHGNRGALTGEGRPLGRVKTSRVGAVACRGRREAEAASERSVKTSRPARGTQLTGGRDTTSQA